MRKRGAFVAVILAVLASTCLLGCSQTQGASDNGQATASAAQASTHSFENDSYFVDVPANWGDDWSFEDDGNVVKFTASHDGVTRSTLVSTSPSHSFWTRLGEEANVWYNDEAEPFFFEGGPTITLK